MVMLTLLQALPPGAISIRRETDPGAICLIMAVSESRKTAAPVTRFDSKPRVKRDDTGATVTFARVRAGGKSAKVTCRLDTQTQQVTSVEVAGQQILTAPQPF